MNGKDFLVLFSFFLFLLCTVHAASPTGWFDGVKNASIPSVSGWACDGNNYSEPLVMHFYRDGPYGNGTLFGWTMANLTREQAVGDVCGRYRGHGFQISTPEYLKDGLPHNIFAYAINTPAGSNPVIGNKMILCMTTSTTSSTTTTSGGSTTSTSTTTTSTSVPQCVMPGNDPPCDDVSLSEVVFAINRWAVGSFELGDVIDLINSWADPFNHPPD